MLLEDELEQEIIALIKDKRMTADAAAREIIEGPGYCHWKNWMTNTPEERAADVREYR